MVAPHRIHPSNWIAVRALLGSGLLLAMLPSTAGAEAGAPQVAPSTAEQARIAAAQQAASARFDRPDAAERHYTDKRAPVDGSAARLDVRYRNARAHMARMPRFATRGAHGMAPGRPGTVPLSAAEAQRLGTWEPLGPGNVGGRTRVLLIDPERPRTLYAAGVSGGVFKSTNGGQRWRPLTDMLPNLAVNSLAMAPDDPQTLYAGTGEGYFREVVRGTALPLRGGGIFKTEDGGASWSFLTSTENRDFQWVNDVVVSHRNAQRLYAATRTGVWRSRNGGTTWQRVLDPRVNGGCLDLALRPDGTTDSLLATCGTFERATIYRATDAESDRAWEAVLSEPDMGRTSLAIAPSDPRVVYALAARRYDANSDAGLHAVFRSDNGGGTWTAVVRSDDADRANRLLLSNPVIAVLQECGFGGTNQLFTMGWYVNTIAVDPADPDIVWAGGVDLFRSDDGGRNWGPVTFWWVNDPRKRSHADQQTIAFHPDYNGAGNQQMFLGNDGGLFRTNNARANRALGIQALCTPNTSNVLWSSLNRGYGVTQFYHGAPYARGRAYLGGTQDNGTVGGSDARGSNGWQGLFGGDGGYVAVDPTDDNTLYVESQYLNLQRSTDGGQSFVDAAQGIAEAQNDLLFIPPFVLDPNEPRRLWAGGRRLWTSTDQGRAWRQVSAPLRNGGRISALAVAPGNPDRVLVGTDNGFIHRHEQARDAGATTTWTASRPRAGWVTWIAFDPNDTNIVYATYANFGGKHVWQSTNGGRNWRSLIGRGAGRLPDIPVHAVVVDPADGQRLYLGTDLGVFVSTDGGRTWAVENTGFAAAVTESLAIIEGQRGERLLFAFTHGRGAWRVSLDGGTPSGDPDGDDCTLALGHRRYCKECGPCAAGEGGCRRDNHCADGLTCQRNVGADFGFAPNVGVCVAP